MYCIPESKRLCLATKMALKVIWLLCPGSNLQIAAGKCTGLNCVDI
jgi:hypothetical protein